MVKNNKKYMSEESEESEDYENQDQEDEDSEIYLKSDQEPVIEKPTMDGFFAYEQEIQNLQKTMLGFTPRNNVWVYTSLPLARDEFISNMVNSLRSIIKQGSSLASLTEDEINSMLMEKNYEFIGSVYLEPSIHDDDSEKIINMHDHMLELFLKTLRDGLSNDTIRQMSANIYNDNQRNKKETIVNWEALGIKK